MKKFFKLLLFGVFIVTIALGSGFLSYVITTNILTKNGQITDSVVNENAVKTTASVITSGEGVKSYDDYKFNYYVVKLEDNVLNIYVNYKDHEELLYGEVINPYDLSAEERELLKNGVRLEEMSKVTELTENFTS